MEQAAGTQLNYFLITHVESEGPFLKVWGQRDEKAYSYIENVLHNVSAKFNNAAINTTPSIVDSLHVGMVCCCRYRDMKYYRVRIMNLNYLPNNYVEVYFMDLGSRDVVATSHIRSLDGFEPSFLSVPPQAVGFVLAEAVNVRGEWTDTDLETIGKEIKYIRLNATPVTQIGKFFVGRLFFGGKDIATMLIARGLLRYTPLSTQEAVLLSLMPRDTTSNVTVPTTITQDPVIGYKPLILEPGNKYPVHVSYVTDGPAQFAVQLEQYRDILDNLMTDINSMELQQMETPPIPGAMCLARCMEDHHICRAVVTNVEYEQFKVFYVDFGNYEVVPLEALFTIPIKYTVPKVMAIRYALAGIDKSALTLEMHCAFKSFIDNRLMHLRPIPMTSRAAFPRCELWDPNTNVNALDIIRLAAATNYPPPLQLHTNKPAAIRICYVNSCNRFYIQLIDTESDLNRLMIDLQTATVQANALPREHVKLKQPCSAIFAADQQWYRAQIIGVQNGNEITVRYVDYGNEAVVGLEQVRSIEPKFLTQLKPQAIECCLNGYQNMEANLERDNFLEEITLEQTFTVLVIDTMIHDRYLVELMDENKCNVASLLLEKLAKSKLSLTAVRDDNLSIRNKTNETPIEQPYSKGTTLYNGESRDGNFRNNNNNSNHQNDNDETNKRFDRNSGRGKRDNFNVHDQCEDIESSTDNNTAWDRSRKNNYRSERNDTRNNSESNWNRNTHSSNGDSGTRSWRNNSEPKSEWNNSSRNSRYENDEKRPPRGDRRTPSTSSSGGKPDRRGESRKSAENNGFNTKMSPVPDPASSSDSYKELILEIGTKVAISWFCTPVKFYCQSVDKQDALKCLMNDIQMTYSKYDTFKGQLPVGCPVMALYPDDNVIYRARVLDTIGSQRYKVLYVDYGNTGIVDTVWMVEKRFMDLSQQSICSSLIGIKPFGENIWGSANSYQQYFTGPEFLINDVQGHNDNNTLLVALQTIDGGDIATELIANGVASSLDGAFDANILLGQQFKVMFTSFKGPNDISLMLQMGQMLEKCSIYNFESASEFHEDCFKSYLEQIVIVFVDKVVDNKLQVTFYRLDGVLLPIMDRNEGAFECVMPICPALVLQLTLSGAIVVYTTDYSTIFVQTSDDSVVMADCLEKMSIFYEKQVEEVVPVEGYLYAVQGSDTNWYRAKVNQIEDEKIAEVQYLDYGNCEKVQFGNFRTLSSEFMEHNCLCIEVHIDISNQLSDLNGKTVDLTLTALAEGGWAGTIITVTESEPVIEEKILTVSESEPVTVSADTMTMTLAVTVSHIDSPTDFYLQLVDGATALDELQVKLQQMISNLSQLDTPTVGALCLAQYSIDQEWYRAQILDCDTDIITVRFVDYGNTDVLKTNDENNRLLTLPPDLLALEWCARRCRLDIQPLDGDLDEWPNAVQTRFQDVVMSDDGGCKAEFLTQDEKWHTIELYTANGQNVRQILIEEKLSRGRNCDEEPLTRGIGFVSHINSPSEFCLQLENCIEELELIAGQLQNAQEQFPELEPSQKVPGTLCAALYADDQQWYRGRILTTDGAITVLFIDYGNTCQTNEIRELPESLVLMAPLAQNCSLQMPSSGAWTEFQQQRFRDLAAEGATKFEVKNVGTTENNCCNLVELYLPDDGSNIMDQMTVELDTVRIVTFTSNNRLQIELRDGIYKLQPLNADCDVEWAPSSFEPLIHNTFEAYFPTDDTVVLYLNGVDVRKRLEKKTEDIESEKLANEHIGEKEMEATSSSNPEDEEPNEIHITSGPDVVEIRQEEGEIIASAEEREERPEVEEKSAKDACENEKN